MYVGFIVIKKWMQLPEIGMVIASLKAPLRLCVFRPAIPPESLPSVAPSALPDEVVLYILSDFECKGTTFI